MHKMNLCLLKRGHTVDLVTSEVTTFIEHYSTYSLGVSLEQVRESLRRLEPHVDFLHAHNEPSYYVSLWKEFSKKPVILDVHDSFLLRTSPAQADKVMEEGKMRMRVSTEERTNFQLADALVFPSQSMADLVCKEFKLTQPMLVLPSYLPELFYQYETQPWMGGIVYEGKTAINGDSSTNAYCDYRKFDAECKRLGVDFHLYGNQMSDEFKAAYPHAFKYPPCLMGKMIKRIQAHDWGLVGNVDSYPEWEGAMPNKLFEYLAANIPIVCMNAGEVAKFVLEHDIGIVVNSVEELCARWKEHTEKRKNVVRLRHKFSMDSHIEELEAFYDLVMDVMDTGEPVLELETSLNGANHAD